MVTQHRREGPLPSAIARPERSVKRVGEYHRKGNAREGGAHGLVACEVRTERQKRGDGGGCEGPHSSPENS